MEGMSVKTDVFITGGFTLALKLVRIAAFNSFFHSFGNMHPLPQKEQLEQRRTDANLKSLGIQTVIRGGSLFAVQYKKTSKSTRLEVLLPAKKVR